MKPGAQRIVDLINGLQQFYVVASTSLMMSSRPDWPSVLGSMGLDPGSTIRLGRRYGDSYYEGLDVYESFSARHGAGFNVDFLGVLAGSMVLAVGDAAIREQLQDSAEVMQFLRHARNAVAHGNRFHLTNGEPKAPAALRRSPSEGGDLEITSQLHGTDFLLGFMSVGDVMDLLDAVEAHVGSVS